MRLKWAILFVGAATLASAALVRRTISVTVSGRTLDLESVTVDGKTYVSLDGLTAGFSPLRDVDAIPACQGDEGRWLFNGVWLFRVNGVAWNEKTRYWDVSIGLRNRTRKARPASGNGLPSHLGEAFHLSTESGGQLALPASNRLGKVGEQTLQPGGTLETTLHFPGKADDRPVRLIAEFASVPGLPFVHDPSFRIDLK